jgi:hypothetical protein
LNEFVLQALPIGSPIPAPLKSQFSATFSQVSTNRRFSVFASDMNITDQDIQKDAMRLLPDILQGAIEHDS